MPLKTKKFPNRLLREGPVHTLKPQGEGEVCSFQSSGAEPRKLCLVRIRMFTLD